MIEAILILTILGCSFWNIQKQQENVSLRESVANQDEKQKELKQKQEKLLQENDQLSEKNTAYFESIKKMQKAEKNLGVDSDLNMEFINIVTNLFEANLNFTPENFEQRKKEVALYLSEKLNKEYFGQKRNTYQDANNTASKLESLEVYSKGKDNQEIEGLIVTKYKCKQRDQDWVKGMNIFKLIYDNESKKIIKIDNLGSSFQNEVE